MSRSDDPDTARSEIPKDARLIDLLREYPTDFAAWLRAVQLANELGAYEEALACSQLAQQHLTAFSELTELLPRALRLRAEIARALLLGRRDIVAAWRVLVGLPLAPELRGEQFQSAHLIQREIEWLRALCTEREQSAAALERTTCRKGSP